MDHMRISGTEPSSVILSQKRNFQKLRRDVLNVPKLAEAKRDGVINPPSGDEGRSSEPWLAKMLLSRMILDWDRVVFK